MLVKATTPCVLQCSGQELDHSAGEGPGFVARQAQLWQLSRLLAVELQARAALSVTESSVSQLSVTLSMPHLHPPPLAARG